MKHIFPTEVNSVTKIVKPKILGEEDVFATVTDNGYFLANGVLVSNCDALRYALSTNRADNYLSAMEKAMRWAEEKRNFGSSSR